jgi:hypothetical protein
MMALRVPDTLTVDSAANYIVSIRLRPGGLSFSGHVPQEKGSFFHTEKTFGRVKPYFRELKDTFFEYAFFSFPYKHVYVVCAHRTYTPVPDAAFAEAHKESLMSFVFSSPKPQILHEPLDALGMQLLFYLPEDVYAFCSRSLIRPQFTHAVTQSLLRWKTQHAACPAGQLYVSVHDTVMDAACFDRGTLRFLNSFDIENTADILYYTLYIWKQTGIDRDADQLLLSVAPPLYWELEGPLRKYLRHLVPLSDSDPAAKTYIPLDILSLFGCES